MPIAKLVFDLSDADEDEYFKYAKTGLAVRLAVSGFDQWLRNTIKWATYEDGPTRIATLQEARDKLYEVFDDHCVDFEVF